MTGTEASSISVTASRHEPRADRSARFGLTLILLGVAMAANSVLGPLLLDTIDYPVSQSMRNQTVGLDAATLFVIAPLAVFVGWLALAGNRAAPLLALGPTTYAAYMFVQYMAGPDHLNYPPVLVLQLGIFTSSWLLACWTWNLARHPDRPHPTPQPSHRIVAGAMAGFVALRYLPGLIGSATNEALPAELATDPAMFWLIFLMDLGVFVPISVLTIVGLTGGARWAGDVLVGLVTWFALITVAVTAMSIAMTINDDPNASTAQLALFAATTVLVLPYTVHLLRSVHAESVADKVNTEDELEEAAGHGEDDSQRLATGQLE